MLAFSSRVNYNSFTIGVVLNNDSRARENWRSPITNTTLTLLTV